MPTDFVSRPRVTFISFFVALFYMYECFACLCDYKAHECSATGGQKRVSDSPGTGTMDSDQHQNEKKIKTIVIDRTKSLLKLVCEGHNP